MLTIDAQVHTYERDRPERPWINVLAGPPEVTGDDMVAAMDAVGVDAAILVSPWTMYRYDESYALEVYAAHPGRFALVKPVDPTDPGVAETIAAWAPIDGTVAVRIMLSQGNANDPEDPGLNRVLNAAGRNGLPVNLSCKGSLGLVGGLAARNPGTRLVVDHLGLEQPRTPPAPPAPFANLPKLLDLAKHENVAVKVSGSCTMSHEPFPYNDLWDPLARVFDAFGFDRCMWGTDWTRAINVVTYAQGVEPFRLTDRLSDSERADLMGGTLQQVYGWSPSLG
ncbi:MAG: amidohydrolase family protein [Alphaproteobacteria bacterium]|nr:amidohydrolase family protein [Alphaproteobacteria bacterium]